ncbi:hypothetical protein KCV01_g10901, partial [Aureobasidium melanogenum]
APLTPVTTLFSRRHPLTEIIVVTSGKGGVGKTTTSASLATGLAIEGKKVAVIDFDVGLRNLDLIMGCERRVVYDFVNVVHGEATLKQALIKDKRYETLYVLAASQTRDKDALTQEGVEKVLEELAKENFDFVVCDSPAGIEKGAHLAMYFADHAVVVVNPEVSSVRDSDRILGLLSSKTRRAEKGEAPIKQHLLLTRYNPNRVEAGEMLSVKDVEEILGISVVGVIPESENVLAASNAGVPVILDDNSQAGHAYKDTVARILGNERPLRFLDPRKPEPSAGVARERLRIIVAQERSTRGGPDYLPLLRNELLEVIRNARTLGRPAGRQDRRMNVPDPADAVLRVGDIGFDEPRTLLATHGLDLVAVGDGQAIPGSYWGDTEAGIIGTTVYARADTPVHSLLHEACHLIVLPEERRALVHTDATDSIEEEDATCYLQIVLAGRLPSVGSARLMEDMDRWGYTYRLGSTRAWFEQDAVEAREFLLVRGLPTA